MDDELRILVEVMRRAGKEVLSLADAGVAVRTKSDHSPVTTADLAVDRMMHDTIVSRFPDDGWLSEERPDSRGRIDTKRTWILDPIDGTRAFLKGVPEFCISAALVENGVLMVGAILNPSTEELFTAIRGKGMQCSGGVGGADWPSTSDERPLVLVNPWDFRQGRFQSLAHRTTCRPVGSIAYALALVADGRAAAAVMLQGGSEWDMAAGALLIEESGGRITDARGNRLRFNQPDPRLHGTIATQKSTPPWLREQLRDLALTGP